VQQAWQKPVTSNDAVRVFHTKLSRTATALKDWYKKLRKEATFQEDIANEVIFQLNLAQEERQLSEDERLLKQLLKARLLGIAAIERAKWKQRSRLSWIKLGDANTRFFHLRANGRRRKNHIPSLTTPTGTEATDHDAKAEILRQHFVSLLGTTCHRQLGLNWEALGIEPTNLDHLEEPFTMTELKAAVLGLHSGKVPGPDGFTGIFYKKCWNLIHLDLLLAVNQIFSMNGRNWNLMNSANITLIPKKDSASVTADYRPISLMHSFAKIFGKMMATRLAPELHNIISPSQSAFIKKRSIHDNFVFVRGIIKEAHQKKKTLLFLKLDFAKAFDSVHWEYLLEAMSAFGFGPL
jgi:hypothetical protein